MNDDPGRRPPVRARIANACDSCKARKVKCDGNLPCGYCSRRQRASACHYSPQHRRRTAASRVTATPPPSGPESDRPTSPRPASTTYRPSQHPSRHESHASSPTPQAAGADAAQQDAADEETEVPREARLLRDAQGKLIFIGDCAPLSFFQTVRQLVTTRVDPNAFAQQTSRFSGVDAAHAKPHIAVPTHPPDLHHLDIAAAVAAYASVTSGLVDLFPHTRLADDIAIWASQQHGRTYDVSSAVNYLVLAIGLQAAEEDLAAACFDYARHLALMQLSGNLTVTTIQAFVLITLYMLASCQTNGAFLFFGIAVRAAYSIGIHRTEINARFGGEIQRQRDRLWKSLRVLDLFLSTSMGRPPATSDVDCTVPYTSVDEDSPESFNLLNASVQIFLISEEIVVEVYSRKKISYQLTEGISRRLRDWSLRWLHKLKQIISSAPSEGDVSKASGACQVLSSYYYAVILVSRPFLMYELHRRLSSTLLSSNKNGLPSGKSKLADACIDSATFMVEAVTELIDKGYLQGHMPLIVSWLFASSLVLGIGLLGSFGRILEKYSRNSIQALEHFAKHDSNAGQYALIARSLLSSALDYLEKREMSERQQRTESSSQLFGLVPRDGGGAEHAQQQRSLLQHHQPSPSQFQSPSAVAAATAAAGDRRDSTSRHVNPLSGYVGLGTSPFGDMDPSFMGFTGSLPRTPDLSAILEGRMDVGGDANFGDLNLFQLLDGEGHIDLGPYV
ncbi:fungal-specific transcription factor domain-containing protein [Plectosphaerella plurivora]|uniref:Fungal-specific transcription factor domain-containing protein n=1 Tax=Plectosphaerella plurivora TaxID=936078 RepID=A0A9P8VGT7_9PEZI|nr:fungal-specific transcription factor domain-containing protein [Plectosphaerella plurivora]